MMSHKFYQDPLPRKIGYCDFTYPDGDYCGVAEAAHDGSNKIRIPIEIRLRRCKRCGHFECPHCRTFCDDLDCLDICGDGCQYDEEIDLEGYARLNAKMREFADDPNAETLTWFNKSVGDITDDDGRLFVVVEEEK